MIRVFHNDGKKVKQKDFTGHYAKLHEYLQEDTAMKELANVLKVPSSEMHNTCADLGVLRGNHAITPITHARPLIEKGRRTSKQASRNYHNQILMMNIHERLQKRDQVNNR